MPTNTLAPTGLVFARNVLTNSPTFQSNIYAIKRSYASNIGLGDVVKTLTGASQGFIGLATTAETAILGVFAGITSLQAGIGGAAGDGYFDINSQTYSYGLNGAYVSTITPPVGTNIGAKVIDDPYAVFRAQLSGGPWTDSMRGQNINFASNGAANASGISTLYLDATTINTTNTLPFRILGLSGVQGGPMDPGNTNPWIEVRINIAEQATSTGI